MITRILNYKDNVLCRIELLAAHSNDDNGEEPENAKNRLRAQLRPTPPKTGGQTVDPAQKKVVKTIHRQAMFPAKTLETEADIDAYVEKVRSQMKQLLKGCDGIKLS